MADAKAEVSQRKRISSIWLVPIIALLLGVWMLVYSYQNQGPQIEISFETAASVEAGKTKVKVRDVEVGVVEMVRLGEDLAHVVVTARIEKAAESLLRDDTEFWVVRARLGSRGVSGFGTLLSGGYIQLSPGSSDEERRSFVGLEEPPVTPSGTPGLHIELYGERAGSVGAGDPILYKGFPVGRIESATLDLSSQRMRYRAFIEAEYEHLLDSSSRFWAASGIALEASADGIKVQTGSLRTILIGGVAFGLPEGIQPGEKVDDGAVFQLYTDFASVNRRPYKFGVEYVVRFDQSVRGLKVGAPVEYRGLRVGRVERILLEEMASGNTERGEAVPVLIRLEPGRLTLPDTEESAKGLLESVSQSVEVGMRASLATGNLLTGSKFVALEIDRRASPAEMGSYAGRPTIPTVNTGLEGLQTRVATLLDKLNDLPLEKLVGNASSAIQSADELLSRPDLQALPKSLDDTLAELRVLLADLSANSELQAKLVRTLSDFDITLESLRHLLDTLDEQPNALIFDRAHRDDPVPPTGEK